MRVLVTGAAGQLGSALGPLLAARGHETLLLDRDEMDVADAIAVEGVLRAAAPEAIVHAAALTDVDGCERDPEQARAVIVDGTRAVAQAAGEAFLVVLSTDYVFDGSLGRAYVEADEPKPIQVYGALKLASEEEARTACERVAIVRTAWLHAGRLADGARPRNFVTAILDAARRGPLDVVVDQVGSPTAAADLAPAIVALLEEPLAGTFHVVNDGIASRADLAREILRAAGMDPRLVRDIATEHAPPRPARRPAYAPLEGKAWRKAGFPSLPAWQDGVARTVAELLP